MKKLIRRGIKSVKKNGLLKTFSKAYRVLRYRISIRLNRKNKNILKDYVNLSDFNNVIIFENNFGWNKIMKQRPQQIAENIPNDTLMIYHSHEDADYKKCKKRIRTIKNNLIVADLGYYRDSFLESINVDNKFLMIYSTDYIDYERIKLYEKKGYYVIYEYVDDINKELMGEEMYEVLSQRHKLILNDDKTIIVSTAEALRNKVKKESKKEPLLVTNGVNYEHFKYQDYEVPSDLVDIKNNYKSIICYYGALASWFDYGLIKKLSKNNDYAIVLLGQDYDGTLGKSEVLNIDNVFYLGRKQYEELPKYGCNSDILIIPFVINDITEATSPVKIFEYMAMEKPIVTTDLPECRKYKSVLISKDHKDFINNIDKAIKLNKDKKYKELLIKEAKENDWQEKSKMIVDYAVEEKKDLSNKVLNEAISGKYDRIIIWRSPFGWNVPLFQRPQHIARQLANKKCLMFYEITNETDDVDDIKKEQDNLYLVNFENTIITEKIFEFCKSSKKPKYIQIYSTNWSMSLDEMKNYIKDGFNILYEYIDDISPELAGTDKVPQEILDKYDYVMKHKDIPIIVTANKLLEDTNKKRHGNNVAFSCNGVDYNFYKDIDNNYNFESNFLKIINNGKINICYYGALAKWFDYELIKKINETDKYNIILFGIKYDDSYDDSKIDKLDNVYFMGPRDYDVLKNYASKMDVLTIPFVINSITKATSPLKLFEYMALKKPIVTTNMDECSKYKSVMVANNQEEFIEKLELCEEKIKDKTYMSLLEKEAKDNDWSKKADIIIELLKENEV